MQVAAITMKAMAIFRIDEFFICAIIVMGSGYSRKPTTKQNSDNDTVMPSTTNIIGQRFSRLLVLSDTERQHGGHRTVLCLCDCGKKIIARNSSLLSGNTKSCGCLQIEITIRRSTKHNHRRARIYNIWCTMKARCCRKSSIVFKYYGGRGIKVCSRWRKFENFLEDVGEGKTGWTLERINTNGHYEVSNICWATPVHQGRNKRNNKIVTVRGVTGCVSELCERFGCPYASVRRRLYRGWDEERAFFAPLS